MRNKPGKTAQARIVEVLNSLETGDFISMSQLAKRVGVSIVHISRLSRRAPLKNMIIPAARDGCTAYCVSDATMSQYKEQHETS